MTENTQAPYITAYSYDPETNEYKGETRAYISPREGTYPLPANATLSEPPATAERKARCWNEEAGAWEQVDDYRGATYWNKATKERVEIKELGVAPTTEMTDIEPTDMQSEWDEATSAWKVPFAVLKERKKSEIIAYYDNILGLVKKGYSQGEIDTWDLQLRGAEDILAGKLDTTRAKFVISLANARVAAGDAEMTPTILSERIFENAAKAAALQSPVMGKQGAEWKLADEATTEEELAAIVPSFDLNLVEAYSNV